MRLFCDAMLARLGRWLRAAGYDTRIAQSAKSDAELIETCRVEERVLISRDRALVHKAEDKIPAVLLTGNSLDDDIAALTRALAIDWALAPFTRCVVDNAELRAASEQNLRQVPEQSRALAGPFRVCPDCGRVFWPGSHVKRMSARLEEWQRGNEGRAN